MSDEATINMLWHLIANQARTARLLVPIAELEKLEQAYAKADTLAPYLDPTFYIQERAKIERNGKLLRAFAKFRREIEQMAEEELAAMSG